MVQNLDELPDGLVRPDDDGGADHLVRGLSIPSVELPTTDGTRVDFSKLPGLVVVYAYPMTGQPGRELPDGWDDIPGARGCTPQACSFRYHLQDLKTLGATGVYGLSTQSTEWQKEAAARLHLPFPLVSDQELRFSRALDLPVMTVDEMVLTKRLTLVLRDGSIESVFYPVFPPNESAQAVIAYLKNPVI